MIRVLNKNRLSELLEARETKSTEARLVIAMEHLCDLCDDADRKRIYEKWR